MKTYYNIRFYMNTISYSQSNSALGGILLIAGCCIGAGMLGLPVVSITAGFIPSSLAILLCCFFMMTTGLLLLEATLWFDKEVSLISIVGFALGKTGQTITWVLFLFVFYCLIIAYTSGFEELFTDSFSIVTQKSVPCEVGSIVCVVIIAALVYVGTKCVDRLNRFLMIGLIVSYCALVLIGSPHISSESLAEKEWGQSFAMIPILLLSFGYHNLIPSLTYYLRKNVAILRLSIVVGCSIPCLIYLIWEMVILGIVPENYIEVFKMNTSQGEMTTGLLKKVSGVPAVFELTSIFSFFAITTSFMTNALSCVDFLSDGFKLSPDSRYRGCLCLLVLLPPLLLSLAYPHLFLKALSYAGGFATVILFGLLPALVVWIGRYNKKIDSPRIVPGGKRVLVLIIGLSLIFIGIEFVQQLQH